MSCPYTSKRVIHIPGNDLFIFEWATHIQWNELPIQGKKSYEVFRQESEDVSYQEMRYSYKKMSSWEMSYSYTWCLEIKVISFLHGIFVCKETRCSYRLNEVFIKFLHARKCVIDMIYSYNELSYSWVIPTRKRVIHKSVSYKGMRFSYQEMRYA